MSSRVLLATLLAAFATCHIAAATMIRAASELSAPEAMLLAAGNPASSTTNPTARIDCNAGLAAAQLAGIGAYSPRSGSSSFETDPDVRLGGVAGVADRYD